jgi:uncharacterized protein YbdZ (MbtH family)
MTNPFEVENADFLLLANAESQYSIWPAFRDPLCGWSTAGPTGAKQVCLNWIQIHWIDMRPKSLTEATTVSKR